MILYSIMNHIVIVGVFTALLYSLRPIITRIMCRHSLQERVRSRFYSKLTCPFCYSALFQVISRPTEMHPTFHLSQWHGHLVVCKLYTSATRTTFENAERHERHSPDRQSIVIIQATMHGYEYVITNCYILIINFFISSEKLKFFYA